MKRWGTTSAKGGYDGETWGRWWAWSQGKEHGTNGYGGQSWEVMSMDMDIYAYGGYTWALGGGGNEHTMEWIYKNNFPIFLGYDTRY